MMNNKLIKVYNIPTNLLQNYQKIFSIELYLDRVVCKELFAKKTFNFKNYDWICYLPASFESQPAQLVYIPCESADSTVLCDTNRICFLDDGFSHNYVEKLCIDIIKTFDKYKADT